MNLRLFGGRGGSSNMNGNNGATGNNAPVEALGGRSINECADGIADSIVEYEREEGYERDDAFKRAADVREYANQYGWDDEMSTYDGDIDFDTLTDTQYDKLEKAITRAVINKLFHP